MNPVVTIEMENGGIIKVELYPEYAPNTVNNFISLVSKGFYDEIIFPPAKKKQKILDNMQSNPGGFVL